MSDNIAFLLILSIWIYIAQTFSQFMPQLQPGNIVNLDLIRILTIISNSHIIINIISFFLPNSFLVFRYKYETKK